MSKDLIQGFTEEQLDAALRDAGAAGDMIGSAALQIALHRTLPPAWREALEEDHQAILDRLLKDPEDRAQAERAAEDLQSWVNASQEQVRAQPGEPTYYAVCHCNGPISVEVVTSV